MLSACSVPDQEPLPTEVAEGSSSAGCCRWALLGPGDAFRCGWALVGYPVLSRPKANVTLVKHGFMLCNRQVKYL